MPIDEPRDTVKECLPPVSAGRSPAPSGLSWLGYLPGDVRIEQHDQWLHPLHVEAAPPPVLNVLAWSVLGLFMG
jgi:hypothetical protein